MSSKDFETIEGGNGPVPPVDHLSVAIGETLGKLLYLMSKRYNVLEGPWYTLKTRFKLQGKGVQTTALEVVRVLADTDPELSIVLEPERVDALATRIHQMWCTWIDSVLEEASVDPDGRLVLQPFNVEHFQHLMGKEFEELPEPAKHIARNHAKAFVQALLNSPEVSE